MFTQTLSKGSPHRFRRARRALGAAGVSALLGPVLMAGGQPAAQARTQASFSVVIQPSFALGTVLDDEGASRQPGTHVITWRANGQANQRWVFLPQPGIRHQYQIQNAFSGLCVTSAGIAGQPVEQRRCRDSRNQRWNRSAITPGKVTFRSACRGAAGRLYLTARRRAYNGGTTIVTAYRYSGGRSANQVFRIGARPGQPFVTGLGLRLSGGGTGVLDVIGASTQSSAGIVINSASSPLRASERWWFNDEGGWNYELENANSNLCLTTDGNPGDQVEQQPCLGNSNQLWHTSSRPAGSAPLVILSDYHGTKGFLVLESHGVIADTARYSGHSNQKFHLVPTSA